MSPLQPQLQQSEFNMSDITTEDTLGHSHDEINAQIADLHATDDDGAEQPNQTTLDAMAEADEMAETGAGFSTFEELMDNLTDGPTALLDDAVASEAEEAQRNVIEQAKAAYEEKLNSLPEKLSIFNPQQFAFERIYETANLAVDAVTAEAATPDEKFLNGHLYGIINPSREFVARNGTTFGGPVQFQMGPVPEAGVNGFTNEAMLAILIHRTQLLDSQYPCDENKAAIAAMQAALDAFNARTAKRQARGVEGTSQA